MNSMHSPSTFAFLKKETSMGHEPQKQEFKKIHQSIEVLRAIIPEVLTDDLIDEIYERVTGSMGSVKMESDRLINLEDAHSEIKLHDAWSDDRLWEEDQMAAKSFCNHGYGYKLMMSTGSIKINLHYYEEVIFRVILKALEHLQNFLVQEGKVKERSTKRTFENMYNLVIGFDRKLPPQIGDIFSNVIKGVYQITPADPVTKEEAFILYKALKRIIETSIQVQIAPISSRQRHKPTQTKTEHIQIKQKKSQQNGANPQSTDDVAEGREKDSKFQLHKRWVPAYEELLLALYRKTANVSQIRDRFQLVFPEDAAIFTVEAIRSKIFKILRVAIKKIHKLTKQQSHGKITPLIRLDDSRVKTIINNHDFRKVRLLILDVYSRGFDLRLLNEAVNRINLEISATEVQPRSGRSQSRVDGRSQHSVLSPPFYHPFNHIPPKVKETRLKYNRQYIPAPKEPSLTLKCNPQSGGIEFQRHCDHESDSKNRK